MKLPGLFVPFVFMLNAHAADAPRACVPPEGLAVGGVALTDTRAAAVAKLGKPKAVGTYQGEDDGGPYTGAALVYPHMELDVDELRGIERIAGTGPGARLPLGLKTGMTLQQAGIVLHFIPGALDRGRVVLPVCGGYEFEDMELRLHFADDFLASVELVRYGP